LRSQRQKKNPTPLKPIAPPDRPQTLQNILSPSLSHLFLLQHEDDVGGWPNRAASTRCLSSSTVHIYSATRLSPLPRFASACLPLSSLPLTGGVGVDLGPMTMDDVETVAFFFLLADLATGRRAEHFQLLLLGLRTRSPRPFRIAAPRPLGPPHLLRHGDSILAFLP
jgi:hypothetical protein